MGNAFINPELYTLEELKAIHEAEIEDRNWADASIIMGIIETREADLYATTTEAETQ